MSENLDKFGLTVSSICAVHCVLTPVLLVALPALGNVWASPWVHGLILFFAVPISIWSILVKPHRSGLFLLGLFGLFALIFGFASELSHHTHHHDYGVSHQLFNILGGVSLGIAHFLNIRACRSGLGHGQPHQLVTLTTTKGQIPLKI